MVSKTFKKLYNFFFPTFCRICPSTTVRLCQHYVNQKIAWLYGAWSIWEYYSDLCEVYKMKCHVGSAHGLWLSFRTKIRVTRGPCFFLCCAGVSRSIRLCSPFHESHVRWLQKNNSMILHGELHHINSVSSMNFVHHHFDAGFLGDIVRLYSYNSYFSQHHTFIKRMDRWQTDTQKTPPGFPISLGLIHSGPCLLVEPWPIRVVKCRLGDLGVHPEFGWWFFSSEKTWEIIWVLNFFDVWHPSSSMFDGEVGQWLWNPLVFEDKNNKEH